MTTEEPLNTDSGSVRFRDAHGTEHIVHTYMDNDYSLEDIHALFGLGRIDASDDNEVVLSLTGSEIRNLKALADAQSFDHPEGFISMCMDIHAFVADRGPGPFTLHGDA